jgi:hypothetical protein
MNDLTDEEYDALDEYYTKNTVMPVGKPCVFARQRYLAEFTNRKAFSDFAVESPATPS